MGRPTDVTTLSPEAQERLTRPVRERNRDDRVFIYESPKGKQMRFRGELTVEALVNAYGGVNRGEAPSGGEQ